jgi:hypothetical protein
MLLETGHFETTNGSKYLQQLCKHFAHKVEVTYDATSGQAALPPGPATLSADETGLTVQISAQDEDGLVKARHVIDAHLQRFAFREAFEAFDWHRIDTDAQAG